MQLPKASDLREILQAARENGVTHLRIGGLEVRLAVALAARAERKAAPCMSGWGCQLDAGHKGDCIDPTGATRPSTRGPDGAPLEDPMDVIRRANGAETRGAAERQPPKGETILDMLGNGARFIPTGGPPDPTSPQ